jgi:uncharacterized protein (TIRG00374 family)
VVTFRKNALRTIRFQIVLSENFIEPTRGPGSRTIRCLGLLIAILPVVWIFWRLDFHRLLACTHKVAWWTIPVLCTFIMLSITLQGVRWWIILRPMIPRLSIKRVLAYHFIGIFYSIVLPTSASSDVIKTVLLSKNIAYSVSWGATWLCRIFGFLALVILSAYGLLTIEHTFLSRNFWFTLAAAVVITMVAFTLSFSKRLTSPLRPVIKKLVPPSFAVILENIRQGIYVYREQRRALITLFLVSVVTQIMVILTGCFALYGVSGRLFIPECFAFIPLIEVIANSGPTPNGMGVREALMALFFKYLNVSNEHLGIYVFLTLFFSVGLKLTGGLPVFHGIVKNHLLKKDERSAS